MDTDSDGVRATGSGTTLRKGWRRGWQGLRGQADTGGRQENNTTRFIGDIDVEKGGMEETKAPV
jgi:hypothetical protein